MNKVDSRQVTRDSLFLLAQLRVAGQDGVHRVKVRNLSAGGMMAEGPVKVVRGSAVSVDLRNLGWVDGVVAWKQDNRFGIAFGEDIDPAAVRGPSTPQAAEFDPPRFTRTHQPVPLDQQPDPRRLRKI